MIQMVEQPQKIKIQFCGLKDPIFIQIAPEKTMLDMKKQLQQMTSLNVWNQKFIVNGKIFKVPDDSLLCDLKLNEDKLIILLSKNQLEFGDYKAEGFKDQSLEVKQLKKAQNFTNQQIKIIVGSLFKGQAWTIRANLLLSQKGLLQFVLEKLSHNTAFREFVKGQSKEIRRAILEQQTKQLKSEQYELKETYDIALYQQMLQIGYPSEKIKEALHRSENNPAEAIHFLETNQDKGQFVLSPLTQIAQDQQQFVYRWLNSSENRQLRIRLTLHCSFFAKYLNSLKYRSPVLFGIDSSQKCIASFEDIEVAVAFNPSQGRAATCLRKLMIVSDAKKHIKR